MGTWAPPELDLFGSAAEIGIAPSRPNGSPGSYTTIWVVRIGDDLYVRSYRGPDGRWFRAAGRTQQGRIRAGGAERDITFHGPDGVDPGTVDEAYRAKYGRSSYVDAMVSRAAAGTTMKVVPRWD